MKRVYMDGICAQLVARMSSGVLACCNAAVEVCFFLLNS